MPIYVAFHNEVIELGIGVVAGTKVLFEVIELGTDDVIVVEVLLDG